MSGWMTVFRCLPALVGAIGFLVMVANELAALQLRLRHAEKQAAREAAERAALARDEAA